MPTLHPRSKSVRGNRSEMLEGVDQVVLSDEGKVSSMTTDGNKFNRKRDRMTFK